jgi:hypothetical protein
MHKSCAIPIRCDGQVVQAGCNVLQCSPASFPCKYLGLPIPDKNLRKSDLMLWTEKIADRLPNCKARLLNLAGRTTLVKFVLSAIPTYLLIAINIPQRVIKSIYKIRRGFFGKGERRLMVEAVSREIITRPLSYGGLGVPNLQFKSWALQAKWLWLEKTDPNRPCHGLFLPVQRHVRQFFELSVFTVIGNGATTLFWSDRWVYGITILDIAPEVVRMVGRVRMDALTSSTQKLKLMEEGSQSTYTLQHPHSRATREKGANAAREKGANVEINGWRHK